MASKGSKKNSQRFCSPDADEVVSSSDGVLFQVHRRNLAAHSDAFLDIVSAAPEKDGIHVLTEGSETLELLFQFVYPQRQPEPGKLTGHELNTLAEAAEKYRVYSAIQVCKVTMLEVSQIMPVDVLAYAFRHGYREVCDNAAPYTLDKDVASMATRLEANAFMHWVLYREHSLQLLFKFPDPPPTHDIETPNASTGEACPLWAEFTVRGLRGVRSSLSQAYRTRPASHGLQYTLDNCEKCQEQAGIWGAAFEAQRTDAPSLFGDSRDPAALQPGCMEAPASPDVDMGDSSGNVTKGPVGTKADTKESLSTSEMFQAPDADIVMSSSDGVLFKLHRTNLGIHSDVFLGVDSGVAVQGEVVALAEKASTLELLFQFVYPRLQPDLSALEADELSALAEAAEKYSIYSAMGICRMAMRAAIPKIPLKVLAYAVRHGYAEVADDAAPSAIDVDVTEALRTLGPQLFVDWILYREQSVQWYLELHRKAPQCDHKFDSNDTDCPLWASFVSATLQDAGRSLSAAGDVVDLSLQHNYLLQECVDCIEQVYKWRRRVGSRLSSDRMLKWTAFVSSLQRSAVSMADG